MDGGTSTKQLAKHIDESIALEESVLRMLDSMLATTQDPDVRRALDEHKRTTRTHVERLEGRLAAHGARRSVRRQAGSRIVARGKGVVDFLRPQKAGRNARDAFATEQTEVAAYELLERIARRAGDEETADVARQNRAEDEAMASVIARNWDTFAEESGSDANGGGASQRVTALTERAKSATKRAKNATSLLRNPIVLGGASVAGGLVFGRRLQSGAGEQGAETQQPKQESLATLSKQKLQARASEGGIEGKRSMTEQELIDAIERGGRSPEAARGPKANPVEKQKFVEGVSYPATREELLGEAQSQGADERVLASLDGLPRSKRFDGPTAVSEALAESE